MNAVCSLCLQPKTLSRSTARHWRKSSTTFVCDECLHKKITDASNASDIAKLEATTRAYIVNHLDPKTPEQPRP